MPAVRGDGMRGLAVFISDIRNCKSKEAEIKRINKEFGAFLFAAIIELIMMPLTKVTEDFGNWVIWESQNLVIIIPIIYMMWLNHMTFRSVGRLSEATPADKHHTLASRKSGYDALIRYSKLSLLTMTKSKSAMTSSLDSGASSRDTQLDRALKSSMSDITRLKTSTQNDTEQSKHNN